MKLALFNGSKCIKKQIIYWVFTAEGLMYLCLLIVGGTLVQRIASCLEVLDGFMRQSCPVVASMVVAEKRAGSDGLATVVECVSSIMGKSKMASSVLE
jgi:hypothetical protein